MPGEEAADRDAELMRRTAAGDRPAFAELMSRHQSAVYRFARSIARTGEDAEDALQETFLSAWRGASAFRGEATVRSWLLTITRNTMLRQQRRRVDEPERMEPLDELGAAAGWGDETPEDAALRREARQVIDKALGQLSVSDREILVLRDLEELRGDEVARILGLNPAAMKTRLPGPSPACRESERSLCRRVNRSWAASVAPRFWLSCRTFSRTSSIPGRASTWSRICEAATGASASAADSPRSSPPCVASSESPNL